MWTNIFKLGELQNVSWFQFLPIEPDLSTASERSSKAEQKDALNNIVLSAHLHLQSEGFLSTWTNSFVGPWDPSQGEHNPDEKIKLWLFLPGRHSSVPEMAQHAVAKLRVVSNGLWVAPGNSEEVAAGLCQALRNSLERTLRGLSYARFGDVFTKYYPPTRNQNSFRRAQPTIEFVFAATEEAIFVHVVISARYMRNLCSDDIEKVLTHSPRSVGEGLPVIVAPSGMLGKLVGCCPSDLVRQVYSSKLSAATLPGFTQPTICQLRGQSYYVEIALGFPAATTDKVPESENNQIIKELDTVKDAQLSADEHQKLESADSVPVLERTFIYPPEAIMVPMVHQAFVRFSSKRMCSQGCMGNSSWEGWPFWNFSPSSYFLNSSCLGSSRGLGVNSNFLRLRRQKNNNYTSTASSISSVSSTSNGSEHAVAAEGGDLSADADSMACHQSDLPSNIAGSKMVSKRPRSEITEVSSRAGKESVDNNQGANGQGRCSWGWDEEGVVMDINLLISEFGDFSDFFQEEELDFGEPPGTAESHSLVIPGSDCGDATFTDSPSTAMDIPEQRLSPVGLSSLEVFNHQTMAPIHDVVSKVQEPQKDIASPTGSQSVVLSSGRSSYLTKAEALLTYAPEYAAVEISVGEAPTSLFTNPYQPKSIKPGSSSFNSRVYSYDAAQSSQMESGEDKAEKFVRLTSGNLSRDIGSSNLYTVVQVGKKESDKGLKNNEIQSGKEEASRPISGETSLNSSLVSQRKSDSMFNAGYFLLSMKTALATEIECIRFQAAMCRIRHTLLSLRSKASTELKSAFSSLMHTDVNSKLDLVPKYDIKRKENIPARLSIDVDHEVYDRSQIENVGVWRSVGTPKGATPLESFSAKTYTGPSQGLSAKRQPIVDLLSAMALIVQQSTSFVDVALDMDDGDGSFFWLSLDEQKRRGFSCDPSMVHAGCGGILGTCHSKDCAGVDLVDPLSAEVSESSVISLLQSDIKTALKTAFASMDGPLLVTDWCRGRSNAAESASIGDAYSFQHPTGDIRESSSSISIGGDSMSPPLSSHVMSNDRGTLELEHHRGYHRVRPTVAVLPLPSLLVGYQDDWLKTSANCLSLWEKAPLEPYASPKPVTYYALCPDIDMLTSAATDFFLQLGTIYEICKLGTHSPQNSGGQMELSPGKYLSSGLVLIECPDQVKIGNSHSSSISSTSEYLQALSKSWTVKSFVTSLTRVIKDIKLNSNILANQKESTSGPCTVIYVVCPFPEPSAVLETLVECSVALGSVMLSPERERKSFLYSQVTKALNCNASVDESSASNVVMLSGFSIPKIVLQIVPIGTLLRLQKPNNELAVLKDMAFTVYNKARRIPKAMTTSDMFQSPAYMGRSQSTMMHATSPGPTLWKECLVPRMSRETEFDASMRSSVTWDNSWPGRAGGFMDPNKIPDVCVQDDRKYAFEPLFILAEPGSVDYSTGMESSKSNVDTSGSGIYSSISGGGSDSGVEGSDNDNAASLHCCYGWTEDWRWLVCIWTDSKGELLDSLIFPFGGISSRQDTKVFQSLFIQILQQGCQIMSSAPECSNTRPRDVIITRIGGFLELEIQEWQKAIYSFGGNEVKKWPVQLRRSIPEGIPSNSNGPALQQQDMGLMQDRNMPSSPSPLYSPHAKSSFMKGGALGQSGNKKQILVEQAGMDSSKGSLHLVRSISLVAVSQDHSLHLTCQADLLARPTPGEGNQSSSGPSSYLEGFTPVKSIGSMSASYLLVPSPSMRYLSPATLQLPTCLTSESPPLAHLLHSKGTAIPLAMGYVVSKAVPPVRKDSARLAKEERPSVLSVSIIDHYGGSIAAVQEKMSRGSGKQTRSFTQESAGRDHEMEMHHVLETVAAELHSLSWMTVSPVYMERRSALPFHCDMVLRLRRLLHYADRHLSQSAEKGDVA
ncbi:mediator of RNA polymerase II transcription subunit 13 [Oryza brachyantha]|uniref:Mediator of RNA polymerase II transcription subunit 13 n=1 Tax=Oryza brachyantha TaxID=4533 RepID=J3M9M1_ORYBR|nr:mediator of RNA polymerase II transcription subunit 13 [Oryza brachyantha]XP_040379791.1 mediator of RNA polymerase II transcription subunit 13 [Oryza brachyantha]